jgi:hypothetical protein
MQPAKDPFASDGIRRNPIFQADWRQRFCSLLIGTFHSSLSHFRSSWPFRLGHRAAKLNFINSLCLCSVAGGRQCPTRDGRQAGERVYRARAVEKAVSPSSTMYIGGLEAGGPPPRGGR